MSYQFNQVFSTIPEELREKLEEHYRKIKRKFASRDFESSELNGAKFCETVYRILEWRVSPTDDYTPYGEMKNFRQSVLKFESTTSLSDAIRFHIPAVLRAIYDIRSKRGVAHADEIDPNYMDATFIVAGADWVMAELVRLLHNVTIDEARELVESLTAKQIPLIWQIGDHKRVISPPGKKLQYKDKVLVLLYNAHPKSVSVKDLLKWTEYKNSTEFKKDILAKLHKSDLLHYDKTTNEVTLLPPGIKDVEDRIPLDF